MIDFLFSILNHRAEKSILCCTVGISCYCCTRLYTPPKKITVTNRRKRNKLGLNWAKLSLGKIKYFCKGGTGGPPLQKILPKYLSFLWTLPFAKLYYLIRAILLLYHQNPTWNGYNSNIIASQGISGTQDHTSIGSNTSLGPSIDPTGPIEWTFWYLRKFLEFSRRCLDDVLGEQISS